jgi:hypothetical protein
MEMKLNTLSKMERSDWLRATSSKTDVPYGLAPKFECPNVESGIYDYIDYSKIVHEKYTQSKTYSNNTILKVRQNICTKSVLINDVFS